MQQTQGSYSYRGSIEGPTLRWSPGAHCLVQALSPSVTSGSAQEKHQALGDLDRKKQKLLEAQKMVGKGEPLKLPMYDSPDERGWIERKAREIAAERGWSLPTARAEAQAELRKLRDRWPKAEVIPLNQTRRKKRAPKRPVKEWESPW